MTVPGGCAVALLLGHRLVQVGIERLAGRVLALDAVALQECRRSCARRLRGLRATWRRSPAPVAGGWQAVDAALQVLGRLHHVGGEFLHRVLPRLVDLRLARARTLAFSASDRIQRSFISASSASSAAMRVGGGLHQLCSRRSGGVRRGGRWERLGQFGSVVAWRVSWCIGFQRSGAGTARAYAVMVRASVFSMVGRAGRTALPRCGGRRAMRYRSWHRTRRSPFKVASSRSIASRRPMSRHQPSSWPITRAV